MSLGRKVPVLARFLLLALLMAAVPACKKQTDPAPHLVKRKPAADATLQSHFPLMVIEFDKALDPSTIAANIELWVCDANGTPTGLVEAPPTTYLPETFQLIVVNTAALADDTIYAVLLFGGPTGLTSSKGDPVNDGIYLRFKVGANPNNNQPSFSAPLQDVGNGGSGGIKFNWTQATEGGAISADYDFYMGLLSGDQDLFQSPRFTTPNPATGTITGLTTGTTYYFRVVCRDSAGNVRVTSEFTGVAD